MKRLHPIFCKMTSSRSPSRSVRNSPHHQFQVENRVFPIFVIEEKKEKKMWYKTTATRFCSKEIVFEDKALVVYEQPEHYEWSEDEPEPCWMAFYAHPAYMQSYPIWSSWSMGRERFQITEEEAKRLLAEIHDGHYWERTKARWHERLQSLYAGTVEQIAMLTKREDDLRRVGEMISGLFYPETVSFIKASLTNTITSEIKTVQKKQEREKRSQSDIETLLDRFYGFSGTEEENALIDRYWWKVSRGNYPGYAKERVTVTDELRQKHKLVLVDVEEQGKKVQRWLRIQ